MTEEFISKNLRHNSKCLPIAGLLNIYEDNTSYECKPISGYFWHLNLHKEHPNYAERFANSYQCFQQEYHIKDFVMPLYKVEEYEKEHPDILRQVQVLGGITEIEEDLIENIQLSELIKKISLLPIDVLIANREACFAALLHAAKVPARITYPLMKREHGAKIDSMKRAVSRKAGDILRLVEEHQKNISIKK